MKAAVSEEVGPFRNWISDEHDNELAVVHLEEIGEVWRNAAAGHVCTHLDNDFTVLVESRLKHIIFLLKLSELVLEEFSAQASARADDCSGLNRSAGVFELGSGKLHKTRYQLPEVILSFARRRGSFPTRRESIIPHFGLEDSKQHHQS